MAINALNSGARVWLADLEDASSPTWANVVGSMRNLRDAARGTLAYTSPEGKEYALRGDIRRPTVVTRPRGWHLPEKHVLVDGEPRLGLARRLRPALLPHRAAAHRRRPRPVLLPAEAREPPRGAALERRVRLRAGAPRHPAAAPSAPPCSSRRSLRRSRWTRSSSSCASTLGPERRPLGLPVQPHQGLPRRRARVRRCPTGRGVDDRAVHARVHRAAGEDLPPPRRLRDGRHGGLRAEPRRPRGHRRRLREGARRQDPRGERRLRRLLGRPPRPRAHLPRGVRRGARRPAEPTRPAARPRWTVTAAAAARRGLRRRRGHRGGPARQPLRRGGLHRGRGSRGNGAVAHPQPHGGRGHGRDLPLAGVAADPQRRHARRHRRTP